MARHFTGGPGGSYQSPGPAGSADDSVALAARLVWATLPFMALASAGAATWFRLPPLPLSLAIVCLSAVFVGTAKWQWWHFRGVLLRGSLPAKLEQVGVVNRLGQTPRIRSVRWRGAVVVITCSAKGGHDRHLFERNSLALAAALGALTVDVHQVKGRVVLVAVRKSAHEAESRQSWN